MVVSSLAGVVIYQTAFKCHFSAFCTGSSRSSQPASYQDEVATLSIITHSTRALDEQQQQRQLQHTKKLSPRRHIFLPCIMGACAARTLRQCCVRQRLLAAALTQQAAAARCFQEVVRLAIRWAGATNALRGRFHACFLHGRLDPSRVTGGGSSLAARVKSRTYGSIAGTRRAFSANASRKGRTNRRYTMVAPLK